MSTLSPGPDAPARRPAVCLTFDVEPDYGRRPTFGILDKADSFFDWIRAERVPVTAFVTGRIIERGHRIIDRLLAAGIAVELHGYAHAPEAFGTMHGSHADEIQRGTDAYLGRFGRSPTGYRAPSGVVSAADLRLLDRLGYRYDSSVFPVRRSGRYDFTSLPRRPFRWGGLGLLEFPVALLTPRLPAGLTFINLFGPSVSARLIRRTAGPEPGPLVLDGHFHNLYADDEALAGLPWALRAVYTAGRWSGGLRCTRLLVDRLRRAGFEPSDLREVAALTQTADIPAVELGVFDSHPAC